MSAIDRLSAENVRKLNRLLDAECVVSIQERGQGFICEIWPKQDAQQWDFGATENEAFERAETGYIASTRSYWPLN